MVYLVIPQGDKKEAIVLFLRTNEHSQRLTITDITYELFTSFEVVTINRLTLY